MPLSFLSGEPKLTWRKLLGWVIEQGKPVTVGEVMEEFNLVHGDAWTRLGRLSNWGMLHKEQKAYPKAYSPTSYGVEVHENPTDTHDSPSGGGSLEGFEDIDGGEGLGVGPVSLMRIPAIRDISEATDRVDESKLCVEGKVDGWLVQIVSGRLYSRRGQDITGKIPWLTKAVRKMGKSRYHLLGELLFQANDTQLYNVVTAVVNTKDDLQAAARAKQMEDAYDGRFQIALFDGLYLGGKDISGKGYLGRKYLVDTLRVGDLIYPIMTESFDAWEEAFNRSVESGGEGIVIKNADAPFIWRPLPEREPKPQGVMWKLKVRQSDDFVAFDAYRTPKKSLMVRFGQFDQGELVEVGKIANLSKDDEKEAARRMKSGPFVMEVEYQERAPGRPGRLRSPRFLRFRDDKPMQSCVLPRAFR